VLLLSLSPPQIMVPVLIAGSLASLALLGGVAARAGGASVLKGAARVTFWSALAMGCTMLIGTLLGAVN
jgi:vacuolar iron transporter family protein